MSVEVILGSHLSSNRTSSRIAESLLTEGSATVAIASLLNRLTANKLTFAAYMDENVRFAIYSAALRLPQKHATGFSNVMKGEEGDGCIPVSRSPSNSQHPTSIHRRSEYRVWSV